MPCTDTELLSDMFDGTATHFCVPFMINVTFPAARHIRMQEVMHSLTDLYLQNLQGCKAYMNR
jgi:hypothetical protein